MGRCTGCEEHVQPQFLTVNRIITRPKTGTDYISNLQLLCAACNLLRGVWS